MNFTPECLNRLNLGSFSFNSLYIGTDVMSNYVTGTMKFFDSSKGRGFIANDEGQHVFCRHSDIRGADYITLKEGQRVEYLEVQDKAGLLAKEVQVIE